MDWGKKNVQVSRRKVKGKYIHLLLLLYPITTNLEAYSNKLSHSSRDLNGLSVVK